MFEKSNNYDSKQPTETRARCKIRRVIWHDSVVRSVLTHPSHSSTWWVGEGGLQYSGAQSPPTSHNLSCHLWHTEGRWHEETQGENSQTQTTGRGLKQTPHSWPSERTSPPDLRTVASRTIGK